MRAPIAIALLLALTQAAHAQSASSPAKRAAARPAVRRATAAKRAVRPSAAEPASARRLQDIHIEGEIPVPQVLFVTAREQRRFMDFQHHHYLKPSTQVGAEAALPTWIAVTGNPPADARKEPSR